MAKTVADLREEEQKAVESYRQTSGAKRKEIVALTAAIELRVKRIGELGVEIVNMKDDLSDTEKTLSDDKKFLAELKKGCATKTDEWEVIKKTRSEELAAIADTIKLLNDDDALELFKKTLPSAGASFLQVQVTTSQMRVRALKVLRRAARAAGRPMRAQPDLLALTLRKKKVEFGKVIKMVDSMVVLLKKEQVDDDHKKEYCLLQLDATDDTKKGLEHGISEATIAISKAEKDIETLSEEIAGLEAGIKALDEAVVEATEQRKQEN